MFTVLDTKSCPALLKPMDCSPPGSSVLGISQAKILEWVAISFSRGSSLPRDRTLISCIAGRVFTAEPPGKHIQWHKQNKHVDWLSNCQNVFCIPFSWQLPGVSVKYIYIYVCVCVYVYINIYYTHIHAPLGQNPLTVVEFLTVGYRDLQFTKSAQAVLEQTLMFVSH